MKTLTTLIGVIAMMAVACSDSHVEQSEVFRAILTPEEIGAVRLLGFMEGSAQDRAVGAAVVAELQDQGASPSEFYIVLDEEHVNGSAVAHLWHEDFFLPENAGIRGNLPGPSSRWGRDMTVDLDNARVTQTTYWR